MTVSSWRMRAARMAPRVRASLVSTLAARDSGEARTRVERKIMRRGVRGLAESAWEAGGGGRTFAVGGGPLRRTGGQGDAAVVATAAAALAIAIPMNSLG